MKLLIAIQASEDERVVVEPASQLAEAADAEVILLNVVNPFTDAADVIADTRREALRIEAARLSSGPRIRSTGRSSTKGVASAT